MVRARQEGGSLTEGDRLVVPIQPVMRADPAIIEHLYADHYRDVFRYVLAMTRSAEDAEDITADCFERALRTWRQVPERPIAWLLLTARRMATDRWRRARRLARILALRGNPGTSPESNLDADFREWFDALARVLNERQREVLILRELQGLSYREIAEIAAVPEGTVMSRLARARAELRRLWLKDQP